MGSPSIGEAVTPATEKEKKREIKELTVLKYYQSLYNKLIFHFSIKIKEVSV